MLTVNNLTKYFGKNKILNGVSFSLKKGEVLCLRGKSGAGKTTIVRCICNLEKPDDGEIFIDGLPSIRNKAPDKTYNRQVGMVSQGLDLFKNLTIMQNLVLAPVSLNCMSQSEAEDKARGLLQLLGIPDKENSYPCQLSGGEKQRSAVARACMLSPKVLFFDEPTSALDSKSSQEVAELIKTISNGGISVVVISHDNDFCNMLNCESVTIKEGKIALES